MRLRLDKLVLSAGLALAMVATTIPVGAAVDTSGKASTATAIAKDGVETATFDKDTILKKLGAQTSTIQEAASGGIQKTINAATVTDAKLPTASDLAVSTSNEIDAGKAYVYMDNNELEDAALYYTVSLGAKSIEVVQNTVFTVDGYSYKLKTTDTDVTTTKNSAKDAALAAVKAVADPDSSTTANGVKTVVAGTADDSQMVVGTSASATTDITDVTGVDSVYVNDLTYTVTTTYTVTDLSAIGYTLDLLFDTNTADNYEYCVIKQTDSAAEVITSTIDDNGKIVASITDLNDAEYVLAKKQVSTAGYLMFNNAVDGSDDTSQSYASGDYTVKLGNKETTYTNSTISGALGENDKLVSFFTIEVKDANNNNVSQLASALSFKIVTPSGLPAVKDGYTRTFKIFRQHGEIVTELPVEVSGNYLIFSSDTFSDYALVYEDVAADTTTTEEATDATTDSATEATTAGSSTTSTTTSTKTADNSMMPLFMTTLLLALCAGSLAIYKEKKTN